MQSRQLKKSNNKRNKKNTKPSAIQAAMIQRVKFSQFPTSFKVALNYEQIQLSTLVSGPRTFGWGLFEFLGSQPNYAMQLYTMYKYARIHALTVRVEIVNTGTAPVSIAIAAIPSIDVVAGLTPGSVNKRPRSIYKVVGGSGGDNVCSMSKTFYSEEELGQPVFDKEHWVDAIQAASPTIRSPQDPLVAVTSSSTDGSLTTNYSVIITHKLIYHVEFFSPEGV